jgi:hypothetical protein
MPAHTRSKNGVASLACVVGIRVLAAVHSAKDVDVRDEPAHDEQSNICKNNILSSFPLSTMPP